jgi:hypothetical protein
MATVAQRFDVVGVVATSVPTLDAMVADQRGSSAVDATPIGAPERDRALLPLRSGLWAVADRMRAATRLPGKREARAAVGCADDARPHGTFSTSRSASTLSRGLSSMIATRR